MKLRTTYTHNANGGTGTLDNVLSFDRSRSGTIGSSRTETEPAVVAVVTVTRFIAGERVHAQVPVFAHEIHNDDATRAELKNVIPELSELLADGAVEANAYLDRIAATRNARPIADYFVRR
jgi:hypothetical protein